MAVIVRAVAGVNHLKAYGREEDTRWHEVSHAAHSRYDRMIRPRFSVFFFIVILRSTWGLGKGWYFIFIFRCFLTPPPPPLRRVPPPSSSSGSCSCWQQSNRQYVADFVGNLLLSSFPNLTKAQVAGFVAGLLNAEMDLNTFKLLLRDFLVTLKVGYTCTSTR